MKTSQKHIRKLTRTGKVSYTINVPKDFIKVLEWKERQKLVVNLTGKKIIIEDWLPARLRKKT